MKKFTFSFLIALVLHIVVLILSGLIIGDKQKTFFEYQNLIPVQFGGDMTSTPTKKKSSPLRQEDTGNSGKKIEQLNIATTATATATAGAGHLSNASGESTSIATGFESAIINYKKPHYPRVAQQRGLEGSVQVQIKVSTEGVAENTVLLKSSGHEVLDKAVLDAVHEWRFQKSSSAYTVEKNVVFELKN